MISIFTIFLSGSAVSATPIPNAQRAPAQLNLSTHLEAMRRAGAPAALAIVRQGDFVNRSAAGTANLKTGRQASLADHWRIASVTKMVTAVIVIQLIREGTLTLDDPVARHLPGLFPQADRTTIRHLLNHTSGLPDYLAGPTLPLNMSAQRMRANLLPKRSFQRSISDALRQPRITEPGEMHNYSNTNYLVLGRIVERATGKSYKELVRERVLRPLKLSNAEFPTRTGRLQRPYLHGFVQGDSDRGPFTNPRRLVDVTRHSYFRGADGGLFSNLADLTTFMAALWDGTLLTDGERALMTSNLVGDHDGIYRYGFGVTTFKLACGVTVSGHEGRDLGSYTLALTDRERKRHFVLVFNTSIVDRPELEKRAHALRDQVFCGPA